MKALYIIAWVCLVLSIIVHTLSIIGPEDILSDIDAFVWILHGGAILLFFPLMWCSHTMINRTQEKNFWAAVLKNCPFWLKKMANFFFLYAIINFILFIKSGKVENDGSTPASVFKGFSGHWMAFYSIEVAVFYSYLKKRSVAVKSSFNGPSMSTEECFHEQYDLKLPHSQKKRNKYFRFIFLFLVVGSAFCGLLWLAFKGYPWFLFVTLFSLFPFIIIQALYALFSNWRTSVYLQKNHFKIWKKGKSSSLADRVESQRLIKEMNDPYLISLESKVTKFSKILFWVWLVSIGIVLIGLALMPVGH